MLVAQMPIGPHGQCAAVLVAKPARDGGNIHAGFNAAGGEQVAQVVMGESGNPERFASRVDRPLALVDAHYGVGQEFLFRVLALLFVEIAQAKLDDADAVGLESLPNQLAANAISGMITS